jgi:hypothetical protein
MSRKNEKAEEHSDASDMSESTSEQESHDSNKDNEDDEDEQDDDGNDQVDDDTDNDAEKSEEESESSDTDHRSVDHLSEESESGYSSKSSYDGTSSNKSGSDSSHEQIIKVVNIQNSPGKVILAPLPSSPSDSSEPDLNKSGIDSLLSAEDDNEENEIVFGTESPPGDDEALFGMQAWQEPDEHLELELMEACRKLQNFDDTEPQNPSTEDSLLDQNAPVVPITKTTINRRESGPSNVSLAKPNAVESPSTSEDYRQLHNTNNRSQESSVTTEGSAIGVAGESQKAMNSSKPKGIWKSIWSKKAKTKQDDGVPTLNIAAANEEKGKDLVEGKNSLQPVRVRNNVPMYVNGADGAEVGAGSVKEKEIQSSTLRTMSDDNSCRKKQPNGGQPVPPMEGCASTTADAKESDNSISEQQTEIVRAKGLISGSFGGPGVQEESGDLRLKEITAKFGDLEPIGITQIEHDEKQDQRGLLSSDRNDEKGGATSGLFAVLRWKPRGRLDNDSSRESETPGRFNEYAAMSQNETPPSTILNSDDGNDARQQNQSSPDDEYKLWTNVGRTVSSDEESPVQPQLEIFNEPDESRTRWFFPRKINFGLYQPLSTGFPGERSEQRSQKTDSEEMQPGFITVQQFGMMMCVFLIVVIASSVGTSYVGTKLALRGQTLSSATDKPLSAATSPSPVTTVPSVHPVPTNTDIPRQPSKSPVEKGSSALIPTGMPTPAAQSLKPSNSVTSSVPAVRTTPPVPSPFLCASGDSLLQFEIFFDSEPSDVGILLRDSGTLGAGIWVLESSSFRSFTQFQRKNVFSICLSSSNSYVFEVSDATGDGLVSVVGGASSVYGYWRLSFGSRIVAEYNGSCNASTSTASIVECGAYCICSFTVSISSSTGRCDTQCPTTR